MANKVAGTDLHAKRLPFPNQKILTACEWTQEVQTYNEGQFRADFVFPVTWIHYMTTAVQNLHHEFTPGDYQWAGHHEGISYVFGPGQGSGLYWSAQYNWGTSGALVDGVAPIADPALDPKFAHVWEVIDANLQQLTSSQVYTRQPIARPFTVKWRLSLRDIVTNPIGNFRRNQNGDFTPLIGTFWIWRARNELGGVWRDICDFYLPTDALAATNPFSIVQEWFVDFAAGQVLTDTPTDIRYSGFRVLDSSTGRWHELLEWQNNRELATEDPEGPGVGVEPFTPTELTNNPHGFNVGVVPGKISVRTSVGLHAIGKYALCGLTYEREAGVALAYAGDLDELLQAGTSAADYRGPAFKGPGSQYVQQEANRGFYIMHPGANEATYCVYTVPYSGTFYFLGDFARANNGTGLGNGVDVQVIAAGKTLFTNTILSDHVVDPNSPFTGTSNKNFNVSTGLKAGEKVYFKVSARESTGFDATAFRVGISYSIPGEFESNLWEQITIKLIFSTGAIQVLSVSSDTGGLYVTTKDFDFAGAPQGEYVRDTIRKKSVQGIRFEFDQPSTGFMTCELFARDRLSDPRVSYGIFPVSGDGTVRCRLPNRRYYSFKLVDALSTVRWKLTGIEIFGVPAGARIP